MDTIRLARELVADGVSPVAIRSAVAQGHLQRVRRGAYTSSAGDADIVEAHLRLITATLKQGHPRAAVSHGSAGVLHGLDVPRVARSASTSPGTGAAEVSDASGCRCTAFRCRRLTSSSSAG